MDENDDYVEINNDIGNLFEETEEPGKEKESSRATDQEQQQTQTDIPFINDPVFETKELRQYNK